MDNILLKLLYHIEIVILIIYSTAIAFLHYKFYKFLRAYKISYGAKIKITPTDASVRFFMLACLVAIACTIAYKEIIKIIA